MKSFFTAQTFSDAAGPPRRIVFAGERAARHGARFLTMRVRFGELPASERFFAGGDTTVRGFARDQLGVRNVPPRSTDTLDPGGFPLGGNALVLFNGELRVPVRSGLRTVAVRRCRQRLQDREQTSRSRKLRPAVGVGLRYKSPVGPIRFDLGFKVPRRGEESRTAWFITFGEAF